MQVLKRKKKKNKKTEKKKNDLRLFNTAFALHAFTNVSNLGVD